MLLFSAAYFLLAAHIRSEGFGNIDAAVGIEVVFEERYEHSRRGNNGVVERMGKVLAVLAVDAYFQPARLCVAEVRAGADLEILLLSGLHRPGAGIRLQRDFPDRPGLHRLCHRQ